MDVKFKILGSSSSGNSGLLQVNHTKILIDAGLSARKLQALLYEQNIKIEELDAVFLTHEHNDHSAGVRGLSRLQKLPIFANRDTIQAIQSKLPRRPYWKVFETGKFFEFKNLEFIHLVFLMMHTTPWVSFQWGSEDLFDPPGSLAWVTVEFRSTLVREQLRSKNISGRIKLALKC